MVADLMDFSEMVVSQEGGSTFQKGWREKEAGLPGDGWKRKTVKIAIP